MIASLLKSWDQLHEEKQFEEIEIGDLVVAITNTGYARVLLVNSPTPREVKMGDIFQVCEVRCEENRIRSVGFNKVITENKLTPCCMQFISAEFIRKVS